MDHTQECNRFIEKALPLMSAFVRQYSLKQVGPVHYFGVDPKGAGRLFMVFFRATQFQMQLSTSDGAAEIKVSKVGVPLEPANSGWLWPSQSESVLGHDSPRCAELVCLQRALSEAGVGWV